MLHSIQACRAVAATAVVLHHAGLLLVMPRYGGVNVPLSAYVHGRLGVDLFFILSGFIICFAHHADIGRPQALGRYAWRRFVRIYPVYWICTAIMLVAMAVGMRTMPTYSAGDWVSFISLVHVTSTHSPIQQAWTLYNEVVFYALFAILLVNRRAGILVLGVWFAACVVAWVPQPMGRRFDLVILNFRNLGFLAGILVFLLHTRIRPALGPWLVGAGIALLALGLPLVPDLGYGRASVARGYYLLPFALLVLGLIACERDGLLRVPRWIGFLGDASYSIYLTHWLALYALVTAGHHLRLGDVLPAAPYWLLVTLLAILPGCLLHVLVERPLLARLRPLFGARRHAAHVAG